MARLDSCLSVRDGRLWIEECDAVELVAEFGSPLYIVSEDQIRRRVRAWRGAFSAAWTEGDFRLLPSVKANFSIAVQRIVCSEGCGADVFGANEFEISQLAGFMPGDVSVNGQKSRRGIERVVAAGARLTIDNLSELPEIRDAAEALGVRAEVRLRVRPDLTGFEGLSDFTGDPTPISTLMGIYKPGVPTEQLLQLRSDDFGDHVELVGLHAHVARNTSDPGFWEVAAESVSALAATLGNRLGGWRPRELDMGGGFPTPRDPMGRARSAVADRRPAGLAPEPDEYAAAIVRGLRTGAERNDLDLRGVTLEIEPGRGLFAAAGVHLATVVRTKHQTSPFEHRWVELDTTECHFGNEEAARWNVILANRAGGEHVVADIVGCSCNLDRMVADAELPEAREGDLVAFLDAGAYQEATASNFNALGRPATVLVTGSRAALIRSRETLEEITARDQVPRRLAHRDLTKNTRRPDDWSAGLRTQIQEETR